MTTNINEELDLSSAFADAVAEFERDASGEDTDYEAPADQDTELDAESDETSDDDGVEDEPNSEEVDSDQDDDEQEPDWKSLYETTAQKANALRADLADTEARFNSWRGRVDKERMAAEEQPKATTAEVVEALEASPELEELFELYPGLKTELPKLINQHVAKQVSAVRAEVQELVNTNVRPIVERVHATEAQAHIAAITSVHPDIEEIIRGGEFGEWVRSLPAYQRLSAQHIATYGSAQDVIELLNDYKRNAGIAPAGRATKKSTKSHTPSSTDSTVSRMKDAMFVKAGSTKIDPERANDRTEDPEKLFSSFAKEIMLEGM